jgi:hypothetical protein
VTDHVSDLQWDRLLAGELAADASEAAQAHANRCTACASRLSEIAAEREAFRIRPIEVPLSREQHRGWRWLAPLVPVAAAIALLLAVHARSRDERPRELPKGASMLASSHGDAPALLLSAGPRDALAPLATGDVVHPGDYLQAGYTAARDGFGAVLSRDGMGVVAAYVPPGGHAMVPLPAGMRRSFPQSTILDRTPGRERIAIVWCKTEHLLEPLLASLRAGRSVAAPVDCVVREVALDKRPLPVAPDVRLPVIDRDRRLGD